MIDYQRNKKNTFLDNSVSHTFRSRLKSLCYQITLKGPDLKASHRNNGYEE